MTIEQLEIGKEYYTKIQMARQGADLIRSSWQNDQALFIDQGSGSMSVTIPREFFNAIEKMFLRQMEYAEQQLADL